MNGVTERLFELRDEGYCDFHCKLIPTVDSERVIGVRTPVLRQFAKLFAREEGCADFLRDLPHRYYDENNLHAFVIEGIRDYETAVNEVERFLPYVDNWATCDMLSPKCFRLHLDELIGRIRVWLQSDKLYTVRFGIDMLMKYYLEDDRFEEDHLRWVAGVDSDEYYLSMAVAWYMATALAKQFEATMPVLEGHWLRWRTHNRTIQKGIESYRIGVDEKCRLRGLRVRNEEDYKRKIEK